MAALIDAVKAGSSRRRPFSALSGGERRPCRDLRCHAAPVSPSPVSRSPAFLRVRRAAAPLSLPLSRALPLSFGSLSGESRSSSSAVGSCSNRMCDGAIVSREASVDTSKPASRRRVKSGQSLQDEASYRGGRQSCKSACSFVRQLRGPHLSTWAWWRRRSSIAETAAASPSSLPQSSTGRFEVMIVEQRS